MSTKTDLAKEIIEKNFPEYSKRAVFFRGKTKVTRILIETAEESAFLEKPKGRYVTVEADFPHFPYKNFDCEAESLAKELRELLPAEGDVLLVGLGNRFLTADSLGNAVFEKCLSGKIKNRSLFLLSVGTEGKTGISPERLVFAAVKELSPGAVILADSLACENLSHICKSIQLTDSGIAPGSGVSERKTPISKETLGVPTVAIGTPTVSRIFSKEKSLVSPKDIDILISRASSLIAAGICLAVFPETDVDFIRETAL